jgi:serine beta-lactamase-like protein LACTB
MRLFDFHCRFHTACCVLLGILFHAHLLPAADLPKETIQSVDAAIERVMKQHLIPGVSIALVVDQQLVSERGYGLADIENNVPATPESVYRLASISKMLTGVAAMQLAEQGKLDLSAPIQRYVATFPEKQAPITAELLLKHQSGIRHYKDKETLSAVYYAKVADGLAIFQDDALLFNPGEKFSYTTYGYNLLGCAIEGASGEDYVSYVNTHICEPAGMKSIQPDNPYKIIPHRAAGYRRGLGGGPDAILNAHMVDVTNKIPGGGWCSTAGDLARFAIALADEKLVKRATLDRMWTAQKTGSGAPTPVGLGCFVQNAEGGKLVYHSGGQPKVSTFLMLQPERRTAVAIMSNLQGAPLQPLATEIIELLVKVEKKEK